MEKQIEEMEKDIHTVLLHNCKYDFCEGVLIGFNEEGIARELYDDGYRKQSVGEWIKKYDKAPRYVCSVCNHLFNNKEYKYCPNCGAYMKGKSNG